MKSTRRCPKCASARVLFVRDVADATQGYERKIELWQLARVSSSTSEKSRAGYVQACVCRACGFTELYVWDQASIPVDGESVVQLEAKDENPYR